MFSGQSIIQLDSSVSRLSAMAKARAFCLAQMIETDRRHLGPAKLMTRGNPALSGNDLEIGVHDNWDVEPGRFYALCKLIDPLLVGAGI